MALFNEILVGRLNRWCQKFYSIKSGTASLTQLLPTVQTVNSIQSGVEDRYLQSWNRFANWTNVAAVAAQFGGFEVRNPANSNVIIVIESITADTLLAAPVRLQRFGALTDFATVGAGIPLDIRGNPGSVGVPSTGTLAALTSTGLIGHATLPANTTWQFIQNPDQEIPINPGGAIQIVCDTANQAIGFAMIWRERVLESSELT